MKEYKKLVRDKIPEIIIADGKKPVTHVASDEEYESALSNKLSEEVDEFKSTGKLEELADILEVIDAISILRGVRLSDINKIKNKKSRQRGSFSQKIILDSVE